jgi:diguanylate cyclase (GGDEF)-like protein/PAS domain S-box-containing protein
MPDLPFSVHSALEPKTVEHALPTVIGTLNSDADVDPASSESSASQPDQSRLQALVEHSADVTYIIDAQGIIRYASPNVVQLGFDPEFWKHTPVSVFEYFANPEAAARGQEAFEMVLRDPSFVLNLESQITVPDGRLRWLRMRAKNLLAAPAIGGIVLNVHDITERKHVELELQQSEERYALAVKGASAGIWDWNLETDVVFLSERWKEMLGYDDALPSTREIWLGLMHPEDHGRFHQELEAHLSGKRPNLSLEYRLRHRDGSFRWVLCRGVAIHSAEGRALRIAGSHTDITDRGAYYDALTGLPSRLLFEDRLRRAMAHRQHNPEYRFAVLLMDLNRFKVINDSLGHLVGDQLLIGVARRLENTLDTEDTAARLGGDEFVVLLEHERSFDEVRRMARAIAHDMSRSFDLEGRETFSGVSIGIVTSQSDCESLEDYLRAADTAMYRAKTHGLGIAEYDTAMHTAALERMVLENALRGALGNRELFLVYQPIIELASGRITSLEALARWRHPTLGVVGPDKFISIAEEIGLIHDLGEWVLRETSAQLARWKLEHPDLTFSVSINVSGVQLVRQGFAETVGAILDEYGLSHDLIRLEITESSLMSGSSQALETMFALKRLGIRLMLDDFGTGYSSLGYLQNLPVDTLKIDQSFVRNFKADHDSRLIGMIVTLAKSMGLNVVSEGVELHEQALHLSKIGCEYAQGYFFSRPLEPDALKVVLEEQFSGAARGIVSK